MGAYGLPRATDDEKAKRTASNSSRLQRERRSHLRGGQSLFRGNTSLRRCRGKRRNPNVISDAGVAVLAANAGLRSAALNVFINAKAIKDRDFAEKQSAEVNALLAQAESNGSRLSDGQNQDRLVISHASWRGLYCVERKTMAGLAGTQGPTLKPCKAPSGLHRQGGRLLRQRPQNTSGAGPSD